ncbi:MAG TPA: hypothetical protein VEH29_12340, partial [Acidimicrobiales bacterium]|nr:hypothetical protein [Acidimicrobiales bacterium]
MASGDEPIGEPAASANTELAEPAAVLHPKAGSGAVAGGSRADEEAARETTDGEMGDVAATERMPEWLDALMAEVIGIEDPPAPVTSALDDRAFETAGSPTLDPLSPMPVVDRPQFSSESQGVPDSVTVDPAERIDAILEEEFGVYVQAAHAPPPVPAFGDPAPAWEPSPEPANSFAPPPPAPTFAEPPPAWQPLAEPSPEPAIAFAPPPPAPAFAEPPPAWQPLAEPSPEPSPEPAIASAPPAPAPAFAEPPPAWQ